MSLRYTIPQISAVSLLLADGTIDLSDPSRRHLVEETYQDDAPIFYQAMKVLGKSSNASLCRDLYEVFVYLDFSGIFDRSLVGRVRMLQEKAERMFRPEGIQLDFGHGEHTYLAFERSASMSRENRLAFVRADLYEPLRERMMLGMNIGLCQLSKLYAYNALLFTSGERHEISGLLSEKRIIVIDNPKSIIRDAPIITVEDDGSERATRTYSRVEKRADVEILEFDGEGLVSKELAESLGASEGHHSFQIRLPYIKGVVHEVDYKSLFRELKVTEITDIWGERHDIQNVDLILTKSMFKGFGWMTENGLTWADYLSRCRKYDHALYISGNDQVRTDGVIELNYQFLTTLAITEEEFRPKDLPYGWAHSPAEEERDWLTKTTEAIYYDLTANPEGRRAYITRIPEREELDSTDRRALRAELVRKNEQFLNEPIYVKEIADHAERIRKQYSLGHLLVAGDNRYLSDDLMRLLANLTGSAKLEVECLSGNTVYAPQPSYPQKEAYTLLRSPHIARNEEVPVVPLAKPGPFRKKYLSHLQYVLMVDSRSLIPERLGGADYDGDLIKTVSDPLLNRCVRRAHESGEPPLLKIPAAEPLLSDANDWQARFQTVKSTFSSRVGQISNAALRRGIIGYDENASAEEQTRCREETETLAILTGLEIDSAKSGVKPDLSAYLGTKSAQKSLFLRYKSIVDADEDRKWYDPTEYERLKAFFGSVDWDSVSSNLELLPYYAYRLKQDTKPVKPKPAEDAALFTFAQELEWKDRLNAETMQRVEAIIADYEEAQRRCRYRHHMPAEFPRRSDIERILFARGQETAIDADALYHLLDHDLPVHIREARQRLTEQAWHLTPPEERRDVFFRITEQLRRVYQYADLFCDFRNGGFRVLGDLICDWDDLYRNQGVDEHLIRKDDSAALKLMLKGMEHSKDYRETLISGCLNAMAPPDRHEVRLDSDEAARCAIALGKRRFALDVLPYSLLQQVVTTEEKPKRKGWLGR